jgi:hypothetical protein
MLQTGALTRKQWRRESALIGCGVWRSFAKLLRAALGADAIQR